MITQIFIVLMCVGYLFEPARLGFGASPHWWQGMTYVFAHGNLLHLAVNAIAIWSLGSFVEMVVGRVRYTLILWMLAAAGALAQSLLFVDTIVVGASGVAFGLLTIFALLVPQGCVRLIVWRVAAYQLVLTVFGGSVLCVIFGWLPGVAHMVHIGGILGAWLWFRGR